MKTHQLIKFGVRTSVLVALSVAVSGCFGPTYGTGKTTGQHLADDLGNSLSLGRKNPAPRIEYAPRPTIVQPADTTNLPAPQEKISETSEEWPETQEQKRARILADIEEGKRPANFVTSKAEAEALGASEGPSRSSVAGKRIYLTDPPTEYREPAQTAAYGDLGVKESKKERARKKASNSGDGGWRRWVPWL